MSSESKETAALIDFLNRREFLAGTAGVFLSAGLFGLSGCGGSFGSVAGGGGGGLVNASGTVAVPAGSKLVGAKLTLDVMGQTNPVTSGGFAAQIGSDSPCLAVVNDAAGNGVLMGFLDPNSQNHTVSARTTAVALVFFALGAYLLPGSAMSHALALIDGNAAISALETIIANAVVADSHALINKAPGISPGVIAAMNGILGQSTPIHRQSSTPISRTAEPAFLLISPSARQDGVDVTQEDVSTSIVVTNSFRRHCKVYVYETTTLTGNTTVDIKPAKKVAGPITLDSVENLSLWTAAKDFTTFFHGKSPWTPVSLPPIPLSLATGTDRTTYTVVVLGSSFKLTALSSEPAFFSDPHYANEVAEWRHASNLLFIQTIYSDIFCPLVCMLGGFGAIVGSEAVGATIALGFDDYAANFKNIMNSVRAGNSNVAPSLVACLEDAILNRVTRDKLSADLEKLLDSARALALRQFNSANLANRLSGVSKLFQLLAPLFAVGALLDLGDIGATLLDVGGANFGDLWTALLVKQTLKLSPLNPHATPGDRVTFTVNPPANVTGKFEYDWTQDSAFATLSSKGGVVGNHITTHDKDLTVDLVSTPSDKAPVHVLVVGYDTTSGSRVEFGRASTTITFDGVKPLSFTRSVVQTSAFVTPFDGNPNNPLQNVKSVFVWGMITFKPRAGESYSVLVDGATIGSPLSNLTPDQLSHPPGVFDPIENPYDRASLTSYTGTTTVTTGFGTDQVGKVTQAQALVGNYYNLGGGMVAVIVRAAFLADLPPYPNLGSDVAAALADANAYVPRASIVVVPTP